jgi:hypothetical protein
MSSASVTTITVPIHRPWAVVYEFAADPANLPRWAAGLCRTIRQEGEGWVIDTPDGPVGLRFAETNPYGVLDHCVSPAPGVDIHVPMRVVAHEGGSVVMLTLFRLPGMSDAEFAKDEAMVRKDLQALKTVLEALPAKG